MTRIFLTIVFAAAVAMGCDSTDTLGGGGEGGAGGAGGNGGSIGPISWVASELMVVGDTCGDFFDPTEALEFEMEIDGSTLTMALVGTSLTLSYDLYFDTDNEVTVFEGRENSEFDPCIVQLDNALVLFLDDPDVSIDQNDTLTADWFNTQAEVSTAECEGVWGFNLPCEAQLTMKLTQSPPPQ
ncbi:MAG: hypothetical protein HKP50_08785 [Myxococcales bacterium]|nr:hypothetical protein [Myxococcales bacterium]